MSPFADEGVLRALLMAERDRFRAARPASARERELVRASPARLAREPFAREEMPDEH